MKISWTRLASILSLSSSALLSACSGGYEVDVLEGDGYADEQGTDDGIIDDQTSSPEGEYQDDGSGVVLGTSWQALSYPYCMNPYSDPDGDGWGWENNWFCVVYKPYVPPTSTNTGSSSNTYTSTGKLCSNTEGTAATMAALATSAAMELGRWQPTRDFMIGRIGWEEALFLTSAAKSRCLDGCANTQALLDFQKNEANNNVVFPGNVKLNSGALRSRLVAKFKDQIACEKQPSNGGTTNCPVEEHTLTFQRSEKGGCDTNFYFVAKKPDGTPLQYPAQLKNKLLWADRENPYIGFQNVGEVVSIDPTLGLNERGTTTTGACTAACTKISVGNVSGQCCSCNSVNKTFRRSPWSAVTYLCQ